MDDIIETFEAGVEADRFNLHVTDNREKPDAGQQFALSERIKKDKVDIGLTIAGKFLGEYARIKPNELSVSIIDGKTGEGNNEGNLIKVQLTNSGTASPEMKSRLETMLSKVSEEEKDQIAEEMVYTITASTILHEGTHGLLDSKPTSKFYLDLEKVSGVEDVQGKRATLVDEGIGYAIQAIFAPEVKAIGSIAPVPREGQELEVLKRKTLGEKLRSKVKEYIDSGKTVNDEFLQFANEQLREIQT